MYVKIGCYHQIIDNKGIIHIKSHCCRNYEHLAIHLVQVYKGLAFSNYLKTSFTALLSCATSYFMRSAAVRQRSYDMAMCLIMGGAFVEQVCLTKWTAMHEAAKVSSRARIPATSQKQ